MKKKAAKLLMMALISTIVSAKEVTLNEAINMAFEKNYQVKKEEKNYENVKLQVKEAYKSGLPKLVYSGTFTKYQEYTDSKGTHNSMYSNSIALQQPIFVGGQVLTGIKIAGTSEEMGRYSLNETKNEVRLDIIKSYTDILKLQKSLEVTEDSLKELRRNYEELKARYELKMITKNTLLDVEYSLIDLESSILEMKNGIEISKLDLKNKIGFDQSEDIDLKAIDLYEDMSGKINLDKDIEFARENNLNAKIIKLSTRLKEASEVVDRANLLPQVNLQLSYGKDDEKLDNSISVSDWEWKGSVVVSYDIWYWGKNMNKYQRAKNETVKAKEDERNNLNNIELGVRSRYLEIIRLEKTISAKEKALESAKENYEIEKERFENGLVTSNDFLAVENKYRKAQIDYSNIKLDYYVSYEKYVDSLGRDTK